VYRSRSAVVVTAGVLCVGAWPIVAVAASSPLPLNARLIVRGDLPRLTLERPTAFTSAKAWVDTNTGLTPTQASSQKARLRREGFERALVEYLDRGHVRQTGVSWVMQLGSPSSARAELAAVFRDYKAENVAHGGSVSAYSVAAVPDARGYHVTGPGTVDDNVLFADGPFLYLVGEAWPSGMYGAAARAGFVAGVTKLYKRVHGHAAAH
jgi:hypothetical protein